MIRIPDFYQIKKPHLVRNAGTYYVQRIVDFDHAFPRFSVMDSKTRPCIPEFLQTTSRVLEGLALFPTIIVVKKQLLLQQARRHLTKCLVGACVLGDIFGSFTHSVLGQLTRQQR